MKKISIVVPMFNEEEMAPLFLDAIDSVIKELPDYSFEIVAVNDGSKDNTLEVLKIAQQKRNDLIIVNLSRNWGHEAAVTAGLRTASGDAVIPMDADLQDPPSLIPEMVKMWEEGYQVVNARRSSRKKDSAFKKNTAGIFYKCMNKISPKVKIPQNVANYRLIDRKVVNEVNALTEKNRVFRVEVPFVGFKTGEVLFERPQRSKGESKYNLKAMTNLAINSITALTVSPLRLSIGVAVFLFLTFVLSGLTELVFVVLKWTDTYAGISSFVLWMWLIINILLLLSTILCIVMSVISLYLGMVTEEVRNRPIVIIDEVIKK